VILLMFTMLAKLQRLGSPILDGYLFKESRLCVPLSSMRELLIGEAHEGGLMRHFGVVKTLDVLYEHFYWLKMKKDVQRICDKCITSRKGKSRTQPHGCISLFLYLRNHG
jgi:hypothetical protein